MAIGGAASDNASGAFSVRAFIQQLDLRNNDFKSILDSAYLQDAMQFRALVDVTSNAYSDVFHQSKEAVQTFVAEYGTVFPDSDADDFLSQPGAMSVEEPAEAPASVE